MTVAGRVVLKRDMGKLVFATLRDRDGDLQLVVNKANLSDEDFALFEEVDLGDIIGATGTVGTTRKGELSVFVDPMGDAHEGAASAPREMGRAAGPRSPAAASLPASDRRRGAPPSLPCARRRPEDDASGARRARVHRVRGSDAAVDRRRRECQTVRDASPRARHPDEAAHLARAVPQADARRRRGARLRARAQLPQRRASTAITTPTSRCSRRIRPTATTTR